MPYKTTDTICNALIKIKALEHSGVTPKTYNYISITALKRGLLDDGKVTWAKKSL